MSAHPYPWARLPRVRRAPLQLLAALRGTLEAPSLAARAFAALGELIGAPVEVTAESAGLDLATTLATHTVSIRLAPPPHAADTASWWVLLEVELGLVVPLVARVTKRPVPRVVHAGVATPALVGAFAAIVSTALRHAGVAAVAVPAGSQSLSDTAPDDLAVAGFTVVAFDQATHVRAFLPGALLANAAPKFGSAALAELGDLPLEMPVVACRTLATAAEIAALQVGDAWMLDGAWKLGALGAPLRGRVWLCAADDERALPAKLEAEGRIVLRDGHEELSWSPMNEEADGAIGAGAVVAAVGDVPIVVRVEVGAARMRAREWSALRPGDVVGLGAKVGGMVTLRVSGLAVAEGELVDLDGEVGVRIHRRLGNGTR